MQSTIFNFWMPESPRNSLIEKRVKSFVLNFGPQHPASHGVLRLILQLNGEIIERADSHIGFLHRGTEKLIEYRTYLQSLPYFDRLDYVSMMAQEHSFCLGVEALMNTTSYASFYTQIRVLFDELTRILNHLLALSTHSLDVGNMAPLLWAFEERERLMELYERVSGARMHAAFYRPNEVNWVGLNHQLFLDIALYARDCFKSVTEIFAVLANNKIWKSRLVNIGGLTYHDAIKLNATGPVARGSGLKKDLRLLKNYTYSYYYYVNMQSFLGKRGDAYDRFLVRIREMYESVNIIFQVLSNLTLFSKNNYNNYVKFNNSNNINFYSFLNFLYKNYSNKYNYNNKYNSMETLIEHFKYYSEGTLVPQGFTYQAVEAPKGELGVNILSDGSAKPFRVKIKSPAFYHLQMMNKMMQGHFFADMVTILGSQDIVFGEVDR